MGLVPTTVDFYDICTGQYQIPWATLSNYWLLLIIINSSGNCWSMSTTIGYYRLLVIIIIIDYYRPESQQMMSITIDYYRLLKNRVWMEIIIPIKFIISQ